MAAALGALPLVDKSGKNVTAPSGKVIALYFSAHWCPPCRKFTPLLKTFYETLKASGNDNLEVIFVSGDKTEAEGQDYFRNEHGDWLAVEFHAKKERADLSARYDVKGIPCLLVINGKGEVIASDLVPKVAQAQDSSAAAALFAEWKKDAGDWRETAGQSLGGSSAPAATDAAAMRAARLARLGGGPPVAASPPASSAPAATPPATAPSAAPPVSLPAAAPPVSMPAAAPPAAAPPAFNSERLRQIQDMGFSQEQATKALQAHDGNVEAALNALLSSDATPSAPPAALQTTGQADDSAKLQQLQDMGFSLDQAKQALEAADGNVETALTMLLG